MSFLNREMSFGELFSGELFSGKSSLNREQFISVTAFATLVLICIVTIGILFEARAVALRELTERRDGLERLEARVRQNAGRPIAAAPPAAFIEAPTQGLASAALQAHLAQLAETQHAGLVLSGEEAAKREDTPDTIRLQATLDMNMTALRTLLYRLESGTPYVFVDALAVQPASAAAGRVAEDPLLRATLSYRALWRKGTP
jgi:general secretion pathway protein M